MLERVGISPTYFLSGFKWSTFLSKDERPWDPVAETQPRAGAAIARPWAGNGSGSAGLPPFRA